jgi:hypothetical protein
VWIRLLSLGGAVIVLRTTIRFAADTKIQAKDVPSPSRMRTGRHARRDDLTGETPAVRR